MPVLLPPHMLWNPYWTLWASGGCQLCEFWAGQKNFGGTALVRYNFLYFWSLSPPVCLMSLNVCISLFLSLLVGSLLRVLYVLVSDNSESASLFPTHQARWEAFVLFLLVSIPFCRGASDAPHPYHTTSHSHTPLFSPCCSSAT